MVNQEDREVFLTKAIHCNRVRLDVLRELDAAGIFPAPPSARSGALRTLQARIAILNAMRVYPPAYRRTLGARSLGRVRDGYVLPAEDREFLEYFNSRFPTDERGYPRAVPARPEFVTTRRARLPTLQSVESGQVPVLT